MRVTVQYAAQCALRDYLQAEFDRFYTGPDRCILWAEFPAPDSTLPKRAISIIPAGPRVDTTVQEQALRRTDYPDGITGLYTWRVACVRQPIQLDIWSTAAASRDELCALLDDFLRKGTRYTLGARNGDVVRDGVLLKLDPKTGFQGNADFTFDGLSFTDTGRSNREREYRATLPGAIEVDLTTQAASARIARVKLQMALSGNDPAVSPDLTLTLTTPTGPGAVTEN